MVDTLASLRLPLTDGSFDGLTVVYSRYERSEPFSFELFEGFDSLQVLTYSASIPMAVRMLKQFNSFECVFGYEGVLHDFGTILAFQKESANSLLVAIKGLNDDRKEFILEKVAAGHAQFFVVRDAIAHSKIYLLEAARRRRVIVGSANLSDRAFSGKQAETLLVFDDDDLAWEHYKFEYEKVRNHSSSEVTLSDLARTEVPLEDVPVVQQAKHCPDGLTIFVNSDDTTATVPVITRKVERLANQYNGVAKAVARPKGGRYDLNSKVIGTIVQLVKSHRGSDQEAEEPAWLSIFKDTGKVLLCGKEVTLEPDPEAVRSDVNCLVEHIENFNKGFHGNVPQHQRDYFMFMSWFYFSPFVCDLRNNALVKDEYIFDYPMFAILFGKPNAGKSELIKTLMQSMFGEWRFVQKDSFTASNLRSLLANRKRFPVVFDDMDRDRFTRHGTELIKDEILMLEEYPAFVLSMNAEVNSFPTEIIKRCLMLYTSASLPENSEARRDLHRSISTIRKRITTALYQEYLRRILDRLGAEGLPSDMLNFSSEVLAAIFTDHLIQPTPVWCTTQGIADYHGRKYERVQMELLKLYQTYRSIWEIRPDEVILRPPQQEALALRRDVPVWLLRPGSKGGQIILDRKGAEEFLGISFGRKPFLFWRRRT